MFEIKPVPAKVLRNRLRFDGTKFYFLSQELRFPNGTEGERQYIVHPGGAIVVPMDDQGRYICIRQYRFAIGAYIYEFPAGTLEPGETPLTTVQRELPEETGLTASQWDDLGQFYLAPGYSDEVMYLYLARGLTTLAQQPPGDEDEDITVIAMTTEELMTRMATGMDFDAKSIACFWRVQHYLANL